MTPSELSFCDSTKRFSNRVEDYIRYRPGYPEAVLDLLEEEAGLTPESAVADIGSGTGIFAELLLKHGNQVIGVEPNVEMRTAAQRLLAGYVRFTCVSGAAADTSLAEQSVDLIVAAQAFHWFDGELARREFRRILCPGGHVALVWNERRTDGTPFLRAYERLLLKHGTDYEKISARHVKPEVIGSFLAPGGYRQKAFENRQHFDFEGLEGRVLSSSYVPPRDDPRYPAMAAELRQVFDAHQSGGQVCFEYDTQVYSGRLG